MSRANIEERTLFLKQHTGGVSKAVWPSSIRRYVATGKSRRRIMILKRLLILYKLQKDYFLQAFNKTQSFSKSLLAGCSCTIHIIIVVVASEIIQLLCVLYSRATLLVMTVSCTVVMLTMIHLMSNNMERCHEYGLIFKHKVRAVGLRRAKQCLIESRLTELAKSSQTSPAPYIKGEEQEEMKQESVVASFPDTPMPRTPLIRVMETIDLSSPSSTPQDSSAAKSLVEDRYQCVDRPSQE